MNAFEFNKIAGAVLSAFLFIFAGKEIMHVAASSQTPIKAGYTLPAPAGGNGGAGVAAAPTFDAAAVVKQVASASADAGKEVFKACIQCHRTEKGAASPQGPNLHGLIGREVAKAPGFSYSPALMGKGGTWTYELLAAFVHDPRGTVPGNRMAFAGLKDDKDLADLIAFLRTQADAPAPLPQ
jgi:cytochrome c